MKNENAKHLAYQQELGFASALTGRAARLVVAAGLAGALWAAPGIALADDPTTGGGESPAVTESENNTENGGDTTSTDTTVTPTVDNSNAGGTNDGTKSSTEGNTNPVTDSGNNATNNVDGNTDSDAATVTEPSATETAPTTTTPTTPAAPQGHWEVDTRSGVIDRYWAWNDGSTVKAGTLVGPENGAGYYAYVVENGGRVLRRDKYDNYAGHVFIADNDGRLLGSGMSESGWVVTDAYDGGLQRYWVDVNPDAGIVAASSGFFEVAGSGYFGIGRQGYVARTDFEFGGRKWSADNDGRLRTGWYVTDSYGQGLQRYWMGDSAYGVKGAAAVSRLVGPSQGDNSGYYAYALSDGRILRGKFDNYAGRVYVADNDGRLLGSDMTQDGWVVTAAYDGGLQRYYVDATMKAAYSGFFTAPGYGGSSFGIGRQGYVARNDFEFGGRKWSADNDGRLRSGWYVTDSFGQGLQRYWMGDTAYGVKGAAAVSRLVGPDSPWHDNSGYYAYALADGRILRGKMDNYAGRVFVADNDGKLLGSSEGSGWVVTGAYDGGRLQRYYVDFSPARGIVAACSGWVSVPGYGGKDVDGNPLDHVWGVGGQGYVLRNSAISYNGKTYRADNDGRLTEIKSGWSFINGHWFYSSANPNAHFDMDVDQNGNSLGHYDVLHDLWLKVNGYVSGSHQSYLSRTGYLIASSWDACYVGVFEGAANSTAADNWMPLFGWNCANGLPSKIEAQEHVNNPGSTWRWDPEWNRFLAEGNVRSNMPEILAKESEWATHLDTTFWGSRVRMVNPSEQFFTSVSWTLGFHTYLESTSELGKHQSYGCIRLDYPNAEWIYNNAGPGTRCMQVRTSAY